MGKGWIYCAVALCLWGCQSGEQPVRGANRGVDPTAVFNPSSRVRDRLVDTPVPPPVEPPVMAQERERAPERDLASELRAAVGIPIDCVRDFEASRPTTLRIGISGIVRPTGMIIGPAAYGSGLSEAARKCIEQRVGLVVLSPLDEPISQTVSTTIEIEYGPPVVLEAVPGTPEPRLRGQVEPLPPRPMLPMTGMPIQITEGNPIQGGADTERPIDDPPGRKIIGPKPRPIDGYDVDENAQDWR